MTDGCGLINLAALEHITQRLHLGAIPTAIQGRLAGAKGMWLRHPTDRDLRPKIWLRHSQIKVNIDFSEDGYLFILDVVRVLSLKSPANLATQIINNLSHNGIPNCVFVKLMAEGLTTELAPFNWMDPAGLLRLSLAIHDIGGVSTIRLRRDAAAYARLLGAEQWSSEKSGEDLFDHTLADSFSSNSTADTSGYPDNKYERAIGLLEAGFTPHHLPLLRDDVKSILNDVVDNYVKRYRVPVPMSLTAFVVPGAYCI